MVAPVLVMNCTILCVRHPCLSLHAFHHVLTSLKMATISIWSFRKTSVYCMYYDVYNGADRQTDRQTDNGADRQTSVKLISSKHDVNQMKLKKSSDQCPHKIEINQFQTTHKLFFSNWEENKRKTIQKISRHILYVTINNFTLRFHLIH